MNPSQNLAKGRNSMTTTHSTNGIQSSPSNDAIKSQNKIIICRICLEEHPHTHEQTKQVFVKPCKCSGSLQFVHQSCLLEWLNTMVKKKIEAGQPLQTIHCEICQQDLQIQYRKRLVFRDCSSLKNRIKIFRTHFLLCIGFILFTLCGMGVVAYFQQTLKGDTTDEQNILRIVFIVGWALLGLSLLIWIAKIFKNFLLRRQAYVGKVQSKTIAIEVRPRPAMQSHNHNENNSQQPPSSEPQGMLSSQEYPAQPQSTIENSQTQTTIVRKKVKVVPIKPAFRNQSGDFIHDYMMNENIQQPHI